MVYLISARVLLLFYYKHYSFLRTVGLSLEKWLIIDKNVKVSYHKDQRERVPSLGDRS